MRYHYPLAIIISIGLIFFGCEEKIPPGTTEKPTGPTVAVQTMLVESDVHPVWYDAVGSVKAQVSATISSKVMGTVTALNVTEGDVIQQGDTLVVIDARQATAMLDQANASLAGAKKARAAAISALNGAKAGEEQANLTLQRGKKMLAGEAITPQDFEIIESRYKQARAAYAQAQSMVAASRQRVKQAAAAVENARISEKDTRVIAPFDGEIIAKNIHVGDLASPGTPLLTVENTDAFRVDLVVPEAYIQTIEAGQTVDVRISAISETPVTGIVLVVVPAADQISRTFIVQVGIDPIENIRSGMFARVTLPIGEKQMIRIPASALVRQGQLTGLFIVDETQTARFRLVRTGISFDHQVEIISGLKAGTQIVTAPPPKLLNGSPVEYSK
jgi:RND family efflux transporter MFP subunit